MNGILLIEDDQWLAESYGEALAAYETEIVASAQEAMDALDQKPYGLVIADVMLERGVVIDLLHELQSHPDTMHVPIILCTSLASSFRLEDVAAYGVVTVLDKAKLTPEDLRIAVQRALHVGEI